jgi:hypothetical protein
MELNAGETSTAVKQSNVGNREQEESINDSSGSSSSETKESGSAADCPLKLDDDEEFGFKLPEVDWANLEAKLKQAQEEITQQV